VADVNHIEGVAEGASPEGPFRAGKKLDLGGYNQIDPSCFVDDDGEVYYMWGQFTLKMAKMKPNMRELDLGTIKDNILTEQEHHFHEGAFLTKRNGVYYLIYADISRADKPTCIGYATSDDPYGPYTYGGVIIDNRQCNPGNWNNHGSIAEFDDQWYVFYHRSTHGCNKMRKACVEPIYFNEDGSIPEVEMTTQGAGTPLQATDRLHAARACLLFGNVRIQQDGEAHEILSAFDNGDKAAFKYLDFSDGVTRMSIRIRPGQSGGTIAVMLDQPWHERLATLEVQGAGTSEGTWDIWTVPVEVEVTGIHALWLQTWGAGDQLLDVDWITFER